MEYLIFQITRFLNPRIFHFGFFKFPNSRSSHPLNNSLPSSTFLFNVTIRAFSRTRVKRMNRGGTIGHLNWHWENRRKRGIGSKVEIALDASARGCFIRRATGAGCRRGRLSDEVSTPFLSFPSRVLSFSSRASSFASSYLLWSDVVSRVSFSFLFSGLLLFVPVRLYVSRKSRFFFLSWRIIKVLSYIKLNMIARTIHHVSVIYF